MQLLQDEKAVYRVESIDNKLVEKQPELSGAYLMRVGLNVNLRGDFDGLQWCLNDGRVGLLACSLRSDSHFGDLVRRIGLPL